MATKVFVYGTLKKGFNNEPMLADQAYLGKVILADPIYKIYEITGNYLFPTLVMDEEDGYRPYGELYEVNDKCLAMLDRLEGVSSGLYCRIFVKVLFSYGRLVEEVVAYKFLQSTDKLKHVGPAWPVSELSRCRFEGRTLKSFKQSTEVKGVSLWNKRLNTWATEICDTQEELEKLCKPKRLQLGSAASRLNECWSPLIFEAKSREGEVEIDRFQLVSNNEENSPAFSNRDALCEWASEHSTFFGGIKGTVGEWKKVVSEVNPIIDESE